MIRLAPLLVSLLAALPAQESAGRPNILFIFSDDHSKKAISAYPGSLMQTPGIDRLAREGVRFDRCAVTNAICAPSRAVILTGRHSHKNGVIDNGLPFDGGQPTFPKMLQKAGYGTAIIGKWHLKSDPTGFDHWDVLPGQGHYWNPDLRTAEGRRRVHGYCTDVVTDLAIDWLREDRDPAKPFLLMVQHKAPHRNWMPAERHLDLFDDVDIPEPPTLFDDGAGRATGILHQEMTIARHMVPSYDLMLFPPGDEDPRDKNWMNWFWPRMTPEQKASYERAYGEENAAFKRLNPKGKERTRWRWQRYAKNYLRTIKAVDESVERLLNELDEQGLAENTIVVYSSDQGWYVGEYGFYDKRWMYEPSLMMPLLVRWPGRTQAGTTENRLVSNLDFAQTFLDAAGVKAHWKMQGRSLVPVLEGQKDIPWRKSVYYHYYEYPAVHMVPRHHGVRTDRYKLVKYYERGEVELFDLEKDPQEMRSVHDDPAYADVRARMEDELLRLQVQYDEPDPSASRAMVRQISLREQAARARSSVTQVFRGSEAEDGKAMPDLAAKPWSVEMKIGAGAREGTLMAIGGASRGALLHLTGGRPHVVLREGKEVVRIASNRAWSGEDSLVIKVSVDANGRLELHMDGSRVAGAPGILFARQPNEGLSPRCDAGSPVLPGHGEPRAWLGPIEHLSITAGTEKLLTWKVDQP